MKKVFYFKKDIRNVTEYYYHIILSGLRKGGTEIIELNAPVGKSKIEVPKSDYLLITDLYDFLKLYLKGYRNFIYWFQGITPEEHYMVRHSKLKYYVFSFLERLALKTSKYRIGVSKYLFDHYNKKYGLKIKFDDVFIMPCYNSELCPENFRKSGKYEKNVFCFAGGMQPWQGFEDILKIYSRIEKQYSNVFLKVYSKELDAAKELISKYDLKNYSLDCVPQEEMEQVLADCKFGFIIRADDIINNVATPTKLATYIGNGIIPVYTSTIHAFRDLNTKYDYLCCLDDVNDLSPLETLLDKKIEGEDLLGVYSKLFDEYFNTKDYIERLSKFFAS